MESRNGQLVDTTQQEVQALAQEIATALHEPKLWLVRTIVRIIGVERARMFLEQTLEMETKGGMLVIDGSRRRTPGGVFFHLVQGGVNPEERRRIVARRRKKWKKPQQTPPPSPPTPLLWEEREPYVAEALSDPGRAASMKLTIIGRPNRVVEAKTSVITVFQSGAIPQLPKGLPTPPETPSNYAVFIATKQWRQVAPKLEEQPDDELIIEGYPFFEPKLSGMAVLAQKVTTKFTEQARRKGRKVSPQPEGAQSRDS